MQSLKNKFNGPLFTIAGALLILPGIFGDGIPGGVPIGAALITIGIVVFDDSGRQSESES